MGRRQSGGLQAAKVSCNRGENSPAAGVQHHPADPALSAPCCLSPPGTCPPPGAGTCPAGHPHPPWQLQGWVSQRSVGGGEERGRIAGTASRGAKTTGPKQHKAQGVSSFDRRLANRPSSSQPAVHPCSLSDLSSTLSTMTSSGFFTSAHDTAMLMAVSCGQIREDTQGGESSSSSHGTALGALDAAPSRHCAAAALVVPGSTASSQQGSAPLPPPPPHLLVAGDHPHADGGVQQGLDGSRHAVLRQDREWMGDEAQAHTGGPLGSHSSCWGRSPS